MLSFEMQYDEWPDIRVLKQGFEKWMSAIEINADKYTTNILSGFDEIPNLGRLEVSYERCQRVRSVASEINNDVILHNPN